MEEGNNQILAENLFFQSSALARKLTSESDERFAAFGLSTSHALILLLVDQDPGIQPSTLAEKLHLKPSTITRLVQKLEMRKLVERISEGRSTSIVCTSEGLEMVVEIQRTWQDLLSEKSKALGERYVEVLSEMISNALNNISI